MDDLFYMKEALAEAEKAYEIGEVPVGAVIVSKKDGAIVGRGHNRREIDKDPLAHAEISAIKEASANLGGWRLIGCDMYVTLEPCPMCCGAIINSRIERVVYGAEDKKSGSVCSVQNMFELPYNHKPKLLGGVLEDECSGILSRFFRELREKNRK
ncbi:MAG: tRNA adenosine(34) deaminase TadA [Clostridium sp.]|nr:tRNA adenosine(34) deaminase TadA [Clostridium sp.]MCM1546749.1 tRNA adenosine(34) deaminase TadA [Ruminococcus sp.]